MFDIGFTELLLIGVVALVVIGPERLPDVARTVGGYVGKLQRFVTGVKRDFRKELEAGELKKLIGDQKEQIDELRKMVDTTRKDFEKGASGIEGGTKKQFEEITRAAGYGEKDVPMPGASVKSDEAAENEAAPDSATPAASAEDSGTLGETPIDADASATAGETPVSSAPDDDRSSAERG